MLDCIEDAKSCGACWFGTGSNSTRWLTFRGRSLLHFTNITFAFRPPFPWTLTLLWNHSSPKQRHFRTTYSTHMFLSRERISHRWWSFWRACCVSGRGLALYGEAGTRAWDGVCHVQSISSAFYYWVCVTVHIQPRQCWLNHFSLSFYGHSSFLSIFTKIWSWPIWEWTWLKWAPRSCTLDWKYPLLRGQEEEPAK